MNNVGITRQHFSFQITVIIALLELSNCWKTNCNEAHNAMLFGGHTWLIVWIILFKNKLNTVNYYHHALLHGQTTTIHHSEGLFRNMAIFYGEELLTPHPTPKLEDHPLSSVRGCLFNVLAAILHIWRPFLHSQTEDAPCRGDRDSLYCNIKYLEIELCL
jgi:hypothetical protein